MAVPRYFNRLPGQSQATILEYLDQHDRASPVSVASVVHLLCERRAHVELSEVSLKNSIAEAALQRGFSVAFDGT